MNATDGHAHKFVLDPPSGATSTGACACGATCVGYNSFEQVAYHSKRGSRVTRPQELTAMSSDRRRYAY